MECHKSAVPFISIRGKEGNDIKSLATLVQAPSQHERDPVNSDTEVNCFISQPKWIVSLFNDQFDSNNMGINRYL